MQRAVWDIHDSQPKFKFTSSYEGVSPIDSYFARTCMGTGNIKWLQFPINGINLTIEMPYGLNQAHFKDEDFILKDC